MYLELLQGK